MAELELTMQRRTAVRYKLRLPVIFNWNDGTEHTGGGFTSDISLDGALIISSKCPPSGSNIRLEILLPAPDYSGEELKIECAGEVTRVEERPGSIAFGVRCVFEDDNLSRQYWG
jgi:hypothetical protein